MTPQFKDITFKTREAFEIWLYEHTAKVIHLQDRGFDLSRINIHETGEILDCDYNGNMYNGRFIDMERLKVDEPLHIWQEAGYWKPFLNLIPERITDLLATEGEKA